MRLQSDPTVKYGLEKLHNLKIKRIKKSHLKIDHPWNTYTRNGIPITPICNPGKKSIFAALNPVNSDYLYFVADKKGGHFFAKTLKEHNMNINYTKKNTLSYQDFIKLYTIKPKEENKATSYLLYIVILITLFI